MSAAQSVARRPATQGGEPGVSHWADPKVAASLAAAAALLAIFVVIEARSENAPMPLRIFANRNRSGAYLIMLLIATAMLGIFFFLTIFVYTVLGYSALKAGVAFLPFAGTLVVISGLASQFVTRAGARPLMLTGAAITTGMYWFSDISLHNHLPGRHARPQPGHCVWPGPAVRAVVAGRAYPRPRPRPGTGLQPAQHQPAGRRRDRSGRARHRGLDRGCHQHPQPDCGCRAIRPCPGQRSGAGIDLPPRPRGGDHPRVPGRLGDRAVALVAAAVTIRVRREDLTIPAAAAPAQPAGAGPALKPASA